VASGNIDPKKGILTLISTPSTSDGCNSKITRKLPRWVPFAIAFAVPGVLALGFAVVVFFTPSLKAKIAPSWGYKHPANTFPRAPSIPVQPSLPSPLESLAETSGASSDPSPPWNLPAPGKSSV
jgi:hypothetical protein